MTSAYFKYRILSYVNSIMKAKFLRAPGLSDRVVDLQMHSLYCITKVVKYLHEQTEQAIEFFKENELGEIDLENTVGESKKINEGEQLRRAAMEGADQPMEDPNLKDSSICQKTLPIDSIFILQEQDIVDSYNDSFLVNWRTISQIEEFGRTSSQMADQQILRTAAKNLQMKKEWIIKTTKQAFFYFNFIQNWFFMNG